jgi:drug/metabolite transporter (DMT)-like permease
LSSTVEVLSIEDRARARYRLGLLLVAASTAAYSTAGYFTRLIALDIWTVLAWRGLFAGLFIAAFILWRHGRASGAAVRAIGIEGVAAACLSTIAMILFLNALRRSTVAEVMIIFASVPFFTAAMGWLWIGERERGSTLAASITAFLGMVVMVGGVPSEGHVLGNLLAVGMTACMAAVMVIIRRRRDVSMLPATCLSAFLCPLLLWPLLLWSGASSEIPATRELIQLAVFGVVQSGLGLVLLALGGRLITATETALFGALETPLAAVWVWLAFGELPTAQAAAGGAIVMAAVLAHVWWESRPSAPRHD